MLRFLARLAYGALHAHGVRRTINGVNVVLPASIARGVPPEIRSEILGPFLEAVPGAVVFDVGANVGVWTALALGAGARYVVAIEPDPGCAVVLGQLARIQSSRVHVIASAAGAEDGSGHLVVTTPRAATNHIGASGTPVPIVRLDTVARQTRLRPDVVKIDVEASELRVLEGMGTLFDSRPVILAELHWTRGVTPDAMLALAAVRRLTFRTIDGRVLGDPEALVRVNAVRIEPDREGTVAS